MPASFASPPLPLRRARRHHECTIRRPARHRLHTRCTASPDDAVTVEQYDSRSTALDRWRAASAASAGGAEGFHARLGGGVATALNLVYPEEARMLVMCGAGHNGEVGLRTAAALCARGFGVCAFHPAKQLPDAVTRAGVEHIRFVPSTAEYYWDVCIDAVLGIGYDGTRIRDSAWVPFEFVTSTSLPVASIDVPSGWDVDNGPREEDVSTDAFVKPRLLISLGRPKKCARQFGGALHYVFDWDKMVDGKQADAELFASNAKSFMGGNGEVYGKPGLFQATLFTKRESRRTWVYPDTDDGDELWDELD